MKRTIDQDLIQWAKKQDRKPLLLKGARQVGKTFALKALGEKKFQNTVYVNFEADESLGALFQKNLAPTRIVRDLELYFSTKVQRGKTLLIFDEIQKCEKALTSLKYFREEMPDMHVCAAGSLLGVKLGHKGSFPVGQVHFLDMHPMSFREFLMATTHDAFANGLSEMARSDVIHEKFLEKFRDYLIVGGMPEAVFSYAKKESFEQIREIQRDILASYELDFAKYASPSESLKISAIWKSIPHQLSRENKKFKISEISSSARFREYEIALQWLIDAGLVLNSSKVATPKVPLRNYTEEGVFKLYSLDIGLLTTQMGVPPKLLLSPENLLSEAKGALIENFVAEEFVGALKKPLFYWSQSSSAEVDFLYEDEEIYPIEVKSGSSKKKTSLNVFAEKYHSSLRIRMSPQGWHLDKDFCNLPIYACEQLLQAINTFRTNKKIK